MADSSDVWDLERQFWLVGPDFFRRCMVEDAVMVFPPPVGILQGGDILSGLENAPRWTAVDFAETSSVVQGDTLALAYAATGRREESEAYTALCSSTYVKAQGDWRLVSHHQTPT